MLDGITVLDLASVGPAARTSRWLSDYGARVVKVGPPPKHGGVQIAPPFYAYAGNRDMQRVMLDLKAPSGRDAFLLLAAAADVVIESFRPGVVDRLGIGDAAVRAVNPGIVYCSTSGYGQHGPKSQWAGHDLNYLAMGGYLDCSGRGPEGGPALPGATVADSAAGGMQAVIAILAALVARASSGAGAYTNMLDSGAPFYDVYACADGKWIAAAAIEPRFYANLCRALGCEQWIDHQNDDAEQDDIRAAFRAAFASRPRDAWVAELGPADTCVSAVASVPELVHDEHLRAREVFVTASRADGLDFEQVGWLLAGANRSQAAPQVLGGTETHTDELLQAAGIDDAALAKLHEQGVIA